MPQIQLTPAQRKEHRAEAHHLDPVVMIGNDGLTASRQKGNRRRAQRPRPDQGPRLLGRPRRARSHVPALADELKRAPIQHIGKLLVLWRPKPAKKVRADEDRMPGPRDVKVLKYSKRGGQRPEVKTLRVLGNQRLTPAGRSSAPSPRRSASRNASNLTQPLPAHHLARTTPAHNPLQQVHPGAQAVPQASGSRAPRCAAPRKLHQQRQQQPAHDKKHGAARRRCGARVDAFLPGRHQQQHASTDVTQVCA
jgi:RNA-binding protein